MGNISEKQVKTKDGQINLSWLKHQYYSLGRSIQDIADKLNVSMMSVRKYLDRIEAISANKEVKGQLNENLTSKPVKNFSKVSIRDWEPTVVLGSKKEKPKMNTSDQWKQKKNRFSEFPKQEIIEEPKTMESLLKSGAITSKNNEKLKGSSSYKLPQHKTIEKSLSRDSQLRAKDRGVALSNLKKQKKKKHKITYYTCKFCGLKLPKRASFCIQCGTIIKSTIFVWFCKAKN